MVRRINYMWFAFLMDRVLRFPLPDIPKGWAPNPRRVWIVDTNKENVQQTTQELADSAHAQTHAQWKDSRLSADKVRIQPTSNQHNLTLRAARFDAG